MRTTLFIFLCLILVCDASDRRRMLMQRNQAAAVVYNPSNDMAGMIAWYNPDTQTEANGANIATMLDRSGNGYNLTNLPAYSGFEPTRRTSVVNGHATVRANATGLYRDSLALPGSIAFFWAMSNTVTKTVLEHNNFWIGNIFLDGNLYEYPDIDRGQHTKTSGFNVYSLVSDGTGVMIRENGYPIAGLRKTEANATGKLSVYADRADGYIGASDFGDVLIYSNSVMTGARETNITQWMCDKYGVTFGAHGSRICVYVDGDSISINAGGDPNTQASGPDSWPKRLQTGLGGTFDVVNLSANAQDIQGITNDAPQQVYPFHGNGTNVLFVWEYINSGLGDAGIANTISNYCTWAIAAGWPKNRIIVASDFHSSRTNAGNIVQANYSVYAGHFIDLNLQSLRDDATLFGDDIHLTGAGWQIVANAVSNVIKTAIYP
jgi:hypothetical protein